MANGTIAPYSTMSKDGYPSATRVADSSKYNSDKSRIAVPLKTCVQRQFQVFLFGLQSVVCSDLVMLHRYRRNVMMDLLVRHAAAVNFEINRIGRKDQLVHQRTTIDADKAAGGSVTPCAQEARGSPVDLRVGNKPGRRERSSRSIRVRRNSCPDCSQQEFKQTRSERRVIKSESSSYG